MSERQQVTVRGRFSADRSTSALASYLCVVTVLQAIATVLLVLDGSRSAGSLMMRFVAIGLGIAGLLVLWLGPTAVPRGLDVASACAVVSTPLIMLGDTEVASQYSSLIALIFLALYLSAFRPPRQARMWVAAVTVLALAGLSLSPAPESPFVLLVAVVAIWCAAEVYGGLTRSLIEAGTRDPLTGLRNRAGLQLASRSVWARLARTGGLVTVAAIDLDRFKAFNDTYGHVEGDRLLTGLADAWSAHVPTDAVLARTGGDEFVLVLPGLDQQQAHAVLCGLDGAHPAPLSFGLATGSAASTLGTLWGDADAALYNAKSRRTQ